jgi:hypothetical protein
VPSHHDQCAVVAEDDVINHVAMDRAVGVEIVHLASPQADVASPELISNERAYSYVKRGLAIAVAISLVAPAIVGDGVGADSPGPPARSARR